MAHRDPRWLDCILNRFSGPSLQSPFCGGDTDCNILFFFLHCTLRQETFILKFWSEWLREPRKDVISSRVFHTQETPPPKKKNLIWRNLKSVFAFTNGTGPWDHRIPAWFQVLHEITGGASTRVSCSKHPHDYSAFSGQIPVELVFLDNLDHLVLKMSQVSSCKRKEKCNICLICLCTKILGSQLVRI